MNITGKIYYNHDLRNYVNFRFDGQILETSRKAIPDNTTIQNKVLIENVGTFEKKLEKANGNISISSINFTKDEYQIGMDYLEKFYPITTAWAGVSVNTIFELFPYDFCGYTLEQVLTQANGYLDTFTSRNYSSRFDPLPDTSIIEYLVWMLEDEIDTIMDYANQNNDPTDIIDYVEQCYKNVDSRGNTELDFLTFDNYDIYDFIPDEKIEELGM